MNYDFVLVRDGEDALVERPVHGLGEGQTVTWIIGAAFALVDDVRRVGLDSVGIDEFLAGDGAGAIVVVDLPHQHLFRVYSWVGRTEARILRCQSRKCSELNCA